MDNKAFDNLIKVAKSAEATEWFNALDVKIEDLITKLITSVDVASSVALGNIQLSREKEAHEHWFSADVKLWGVIICVLAALLMIVAGIVAVYALRCQGRLNRTKITQNFNSAVAKNEPASNEQRPTAEQQPSQPQDTFINTVQETST